MPLLGFELARAAADQFAPAQLGASRGPPGFFLPRWQRETIRGIGLASSTSPCVRARGRRGRPSTRRCRPWGLLSWPPTSLSPVSAPLVCRVLGGARGAHGGSRLPAGRLERVQEEPQQAHPPRQPAQRRLVPHSAPVVATFFRGEVERSRGERMAREGQTLVGLSKRWAWGVGLPRRRRVPSVLSTCGQPA
jgi:hypothetical protein